MVEMKDCSFLLLNFKVSSLFVAHSVVGQRKWRDWSSNLWKKGRWACSAHHNKEAKQSGAPVGSTVHPPSCLPKDPDRWATVFPKMCQIQQQKAKSRLKQAQVPESETFQTIHLGFCSQFDIHSHSLLQTHLHLCPPAVQLWIFWGSGPVAQTAPCLR